MRAFEFLKETVLQGSSTKSVLGYLNNMLKVDSLAIGVDGEKASGLKLTDGSRTKITALIAGFKAGTVSKNDVMDTKLDFDNGSTYAIKAIHKSPDIKAPGAAGDTSPDSDPDATKGGATKFWNDGEVSETFLGAALFARFASQELVTVDAVKEAIKTFKVIPGGFSASATRNGVDPIEIVALNKPQNNQVVTDYVNNYDELSSKFPKGIKGLDVLINSCVAYVNESSKVEEAIAKADNNPDKDKIAIKTDGVSDQKGTKADLKFSIGNDEQLLSLKANAVKQFGQDTGATPEVIKTFFSRFLPDLAVTTNSEWPEMSRQKTAERKKAGEDLQAIANQVYGYIGEVYQKAGAAIEAKLSDPTSAALVVEDLYAGITHHAQGKEANQTLVILNPGGKKAWQELSFGPSLKEALQSFRLEVKQFTAGVSGETNHMLQIFGRGIDSVAAVAQAQNVETPKDAEAAAQTVIKKKPKPVDKEMLIQLRSYVQEAGPTIRNIVEMGPLLKTITEVQKIEKALDNMPEPAKEEPAKPDELAAIKKNAGIKPAPAAQPAAQPAAPAVAAAPQTEPQV
jgi:hypothetical protein